MCSEWHTLGVSAIARDHVIGEVLGVRAREAHALQAIVGQRAAGPQELAEGVPIPELHAVRVDVLPEEGHLEHALSDQRPHLGEDLARPAVLLAPPQRRHDAERTRVVAAHRDRDPSGVRRLPPRRQRRREDLQRLEDLHLGRRVVPGPLQQHGQGADVVGAEDDVDPRGPADDLAPVLLREASAHRDLHAGMGVLDGTEMTQVAVQAVVGVLPDRARVEHDDVGGARRLRPDVAGRLQQPRDAFGVVHIHLAAVRPDLVGSRRADIGVGLDCRGHLEGPG